MSIINTYDVIVIGGGPAGMMAAGRAAERGLHVLLIEKNAVLGKKLSITGGGRCNITNAEFNIRELLRHYGDAEQFLYSPFSQFDVQRTFKFFTDKKLPLIIEDRKRAFPETQKASDVTQTMIEYIKKNNVTVLIDTCVDGFKMLNGKIVGIITKQGTFIAKSYIVASGGKSHTETGSTGEGISWLSQIGHTVHESNPNLVPLVVDDVWVRRISGTTLKNVGVVFRQETKKISKSGNVLCTHFGLSGPLILNSALEVKEMLKNGVVTGVVDLFPKDDVGAVRDKLQDILKKHQNKTLANALREWFEKGIVDAVLESFSHDVKICKAHSLEKTVRNAIVDRMKGIPLTVTGTMGYDWAVVSDGGVDLEELDTKTMRSKLHTNLYVVGDVLHIARPSGGYSLQLCWTTGWVAGDNVGKG
ncbi:MAG: aminoacetone oxidase family FAD-binding enzyme [Candidatus Pacebacteria bacterium]|nr:aminoacetone oxidase family FAD-binding enzyme [Candidatus Paceibacterota bacterium]MCF7857235.1 aminoacetone oxidase family FAD-binding enzyme [Candidatus Paceibacterota bacterium]